MVVAGKIVAGLQILCIEAVLNDPSGPLTGQRQRLTAAGRNRGLPLNCRRALICGDASICLMLTLRGRCGGHKVHNIDRGGASLRYVLSRRNDHAHQ